MDLPDVPPVPAAEFRSIEGLAFPLLETTLPNGLRVWIQPRTDATSVTAWLVFHTGSRFEDERTSGASHLLEHMLFVGTERWSEPEIRAFVDAEGGQFNGWTSTEQVGYWGRFPKGRSQALLGWLSQVGFHPTLPADKLDKERDVVFEERGGRDGWTVRGMRALGLGRRFYTEIHRALWPGSTRGQQVIGEDESLEGIDIATLRSYYERFYTAQNAVLMVLGPDDPAALLEDVRATFGSAPSGASAPPLAAEAPSPRLGGRYSVVATSVEDRCVVALAARGPGLADGSLWAAEVLNRYLYTLLTDDLRGERGLAYGISTRNEARSDGGELHIESEVDCANTDTVATAFAAAVDAVRAGEVDEARLALARSVVAGRWALRMEDSGDRADWVTARFALGADPFANAHPQDAVPAVTAADVTAAAVRWWAPDTRGIWVLRPFLTIRQAWIAAGIGLVLVGGLVRWVRARMRRAETTSASRPAQRTNAE